MAIFQRNSSWRQKFRDAFKGLAQGMVAQNSFWVHLPAAVVVPAIGWYLQVSTSELAILIICIALVLSAELFNSSVEQMARAITDEFSPEIERSLNIASGAVLMTAIGSVVVAVVILGPRLLELLQGQ